MLDLRYIRENLEAVRRNCAERCVEVDLDRLVELEDLHRRLAQEQQAVRERRNAQARELKGRKPSEEERALGRELKEREAQLEEQLRTAAAELAGLHARVPNMSHPLVPVGLVLGAQARHGDPSIPICI